MDAPKYQKGNIFPEYRLSMDLIEYEAQAEYLKECDLRGENIISAKQKFEMFKFFSFHTFLVRSTSWQYCTNYNKN